MIRFFKTTIWTMKLAEHSFVTRALIKTVRIAILSFRYFIRNNCMLRASALTYYTLLSFRSPRLHLPLRRDSDCMPDWKNGCGTLWRTNPKSPKRSSNSPPPCWIPPKVES